MALCLSILLYGSEVWSLREDLLSRLRSFRHRCVRTMCRINIAHTIRHHISTSSLLARFGIEPLETYYHRRLLRWAGHVSRMPLNRLPRMLLTGWVANPRPLGCPQMTWVRAPKKALSSNGLPTDFAAWHQLAANRNSVGGQLVRHQTPPRTGRPSGRSSGMAPRKPSKDLNLI